ncbi:MAG: hypothetical protein JWM80_6561 [Cyanobacteria bacterium RYN_339]|nr:hypothetical protein [Cyanobacteria bacterium RYN_339]
MTTINNATFRPSTTPALDKLVPQPNHHRLPGLRPMPGDSLHLGSSGKQHGMVKLQPGQDPVDAIRKAIGDPNADVRPMPNKGQQGFLKLQPGQDPVDAIRKAIGDPNADVRPLNGRCPISNSDRRLRSTFSLEG